MLERDATDLRFVDGGDAGFYVCLGEEGISQPVNARVHALAAALEGTTGVTDLIPGYWNLFVEFDPDLTSRTKLEREIRKRLSSALPEAVGREVVIPVRYDGADLPDIETLTGLTRAEIIQLHSSRAYTVFAVGFTPGFPYMGTLDERLRVPRLATPRATTPRNSVAIANLQTGIYPMPSPGGWRVVGTALEDVFDATRDEPFLLCAGDRVRFEPQPSPGTRSPRATLSRKPGEGQISPQRNQGEGKAVARILEPGLLSTLQDFGRRMVGRFGLARAGALDAYSHRVANALLGNHPDAPTLEMTLRGVTLEVLEDSVFAVAGSGMRVLRNGSSVPMNSSFAMRRGDRLAFPPEVSTGARGVRSYLAVRGGFVGQSVYGSQSTDLRAGLGGARLEAGMILHAREARPIRGGRRFATFDSSLEEMVLHVTPGPQAQLFPLEAWRALTSTSYRVLTGDRMGLRLEGAALNAERFEIVSEGVPVGSLQVPSSGQPMLLLNDRGTLGGYAKIAVVKRADFKRAAQLRSGDRVRFRLETFHVV
jgi:KipI family sensor histidine kinase inhibitor